MKSGDIFYFVALPPVVEHGGINQFVASKTKRPLYNVSYLDFATISTCTNSELLKERK